MEGQRKNPFKLANYLKLKIILTNVFLSLILLFLPQVVYAATLYLAPASGNYEIGDSFSVGIYLNSPDQSVNAVSGQLAFPTDKLQVTSLAKSGSIVSLWVQEPSYTVGNVSFEGIVLNPGFTGSAGKVLTVNFKVKAAGAAKVYFTAGSILANDGQGTNVLTGLGAANYNLSAITTPAPGALKPTETTAPPPSSGAPAAPVVVSTTHPEPEKWYAHNAPELSWMLPTGVNAIRLLVSKQPASPPTITYAPPVADRKLDQLADGVWYFHIQFRNQFGWGTTAHYRLGIDTATPAPFTLALDNGGDATNPTPIVKLATTDALSGIEYYEVRVGEAEPIRITAADLTNDSYRLPPQGPGQYNLLVKAVDKAGNETLAATNLEIAPLVAPRITDYPANLYTDNFLTVRGASQYPEATITVWVKKEGEEAREFSVTTDPRGDWLFVYDRRLGQGTYQFWARVTDGRGAQSLATEKLTIAVHLPVLIKFGAVVVTYLSVVITLVALLLLLIMTIIYSWYRIIRWRRNIRRETEEIKESVHRAFDALHEAVREQVNDLDKLKKSSLNTREKKICRELKKALKKSEEQIEKEIRDVEEELG